MSFSSSMIRTFFAMVRSSGLSSGCRSPVAKGGPCLRGVNSSQNLANRHTQRRIVEGADQTVNHIRVFELLELGRGAFDEFGVGAPERRTQVFRRQSTGLTALSGYRAERHQRLLAALEASDRPDSSQSAAVGFDERLDRLLAFALGLLFRIHDLGEIGLVGEILHRHPPHRPGVFRVFGDGLDDPPVGDLRETHSDEFEVLGLLEQFRHHPLREDPLDGHQTDIKRLRPSGDLFQLHVVAESDTAVRRTLGESSAHATSIKISGSSSFSTAARRTRGFGFVWSLF